MQDYILFRIKKHSRERLYAHLQKIIGVPEASRQMAVYLTHSKYLNKEVHLKLTNKRCLVMAVDAKNDERTPPVSFSIKNKGIKSLLRLLKDGGYDKGTIGEALSLTYSVEGQIVIKIVVDSFIGDLLYFYSGVKNKKIKQFINRNLSSGLLKKLDKNKISRIIEGLKLPKHEIINELGVLNKDLYQFCLSTGMDISSDLVSLSEFIEISSNDYSKLETVFLEIMGVTLLGKESIKNTSLYKPVSIIIPCYNSENSFLKTIASIQSQDLPEESLKKTEIILIDDASTIPVENILKKYKGEIITRIKTVRLAKNSGISTARNIGVDLAQNDTVIFVDSDILLSKNYLLEMSIRNSLIPNAIFISFKCNIDTKNPITNFEKIKKGLSIPNLSKDMRVVKQLNPSIQGILNNNRDKSVEILSETNYFKDFGFGRKVGIFDLPSMVIGHNMSLRRKTFFKVGGFSNHFTGWGMEDSYFGARLIAHHNFIIPVLSCGVYHIDHLPRSGSEGKKQKELKQNLKTYKRLLESAFRRD